MSQPVLAPERDDDRLSPNPNLLIAVKGGADDWLRDGAARMVDLSRGDMLVRRAETVRYIYFPETAVLGVVSEVADGRRMLRDACPGWGWIGIPETRQIRGKNGAPGPGYRQKARESPPGVGARVQAQEGGPLLEAAPRGDGIVDVELPVTALEIAAADPGWRRRRRAGGRGFGHNAGRIVPQRQFGFKLFA